MRIELTSRQLTSKGGFGCVRAASTARRTPAMMMQCSIEIMHILCVQNEELGKVKRTERKHVKLACFVHRPFSFIFSETGDSDIVEKGWITSKVQCTC